MTELKKGKILLGGIIAFAVILIICLAAFLPVTIAHADGQHSVGFVIKEHSDVYFEETGNNKVQNTMTGVDGKLAHLPELYRTDSLDYRFDGWFIVDTNTQVTADTVLNSDVTLVDRWTYTAFDNDYKVSTIHIDNAALEYGTKQGEYNANVAIANVDGITATSGTTFTIYKGLNKSGDALQGNEDVEFGKNYSVVTTVTLKNGYKFDDQLVVTSNSGLVASKYYRGNFWHTSWSTTANQVELVINFVNSEDYYFLQQPESRDLENYAEYHYYYLLNEPLGGEDVESVLLQEKNNQGEWQLFGPATMVVSPYIDTTKTFRLVASYQHGTVYSEPWTVSWACINPTIESVNIGIDVPKTGAYASYDATKGSCRFVFANTNSATTQNGISWSGSVSGALPVNNAMFNNSEDYTVSVKLIAQEGYSFANDVTATFNGYRDAIVSGNPSGITITYTFEKDAPVTHTVYFNASLYGAGTMDPVVVNDGEEYILPACTFIPYANYTFAAWNISSEMKMPGDAIIVDSNQHVFAVWQAASTPASEGFTTQPTGGTTAAGSYYTASFEVDNGINYNSIAVLEYDENSGTWGGMHIVRDNISITVDGKIKQYGFYVEEATSKLLRLYAYRDAVCVAKSDTFTVTWTPSAFTKQPQSANVVIGAAYNITWDTTFDARFRILYWDTAESDWSLFQDGATNGHSFSVTRNTEQALTCKVVADTRYTMSNGATNYVYEVAESQPFIVTWQEAVINEYMVSYNDNGGQGTMIGDIVEEGGTFTLEHCDYEAPDGQRFKGWAVGSVNATPLKQQGDVITITSDTVIYAIWEDIPAEPAPSASAVATDPGNMFTQSAAATSTADATTGATATLGPEKSGGLGGGAIAAIVIGAALVLGGGFCLYWFVFKKK